MCKDTIRLTKNNREKLLQYFTDNGMLTNRWKVNSINQYYYLNHKLELQLGSKPKEGYREVFLDTTTNATKTLNKKLSKKLSKKLLIEMLTIAHLKGKLGEDIDNYEQFLKDYIS